MAFPHDDYPVTHANDFGQVRGNQYNAFSGLGELIHDLINLRLGPHIHAAGWLVQNQYGRVGFQHLGKYHLLLVAAAEFTGQLLQAADFNVEPFDLCVNPLSLQLLIQMNEMGYLIQ